MIEINLARRLLYQRVREREFMKNTTHTQTDLSQEQFGKVQGNKKNITSKTTTPRIYLMNFTQITYTFAETCGIKLKRYMLPIRKLCKIIDYVI